jgi:transposase InsO family protein
VTLHQNARTCPASRRLLCRRVEDEGWTLRQAAEAAGLSERRAREWLGRWRAGDHDLDDRSSVAHQLPHRTPRQVEDAICALRELRFSGTRVAATLGLPERTVRSVLARHGLARLAALDTREPPVRYERPTPGELVHIDVKKLGRIERVGHRIHGDRTSRARGAGWEFLHVCVDDCTRLAYAEVLADERTPTVIAFLERAVAHLAALGVRVQRLMTDNGPAYRSHLHAAVCRRMGIRHIFTRPYRPRTNGKVERMIQTLLREWAYAAAYPTSAARTRALPGYLGWYNTTRPHKSLDGRPPAERLAERINAAASDI